MGARGARRSTGFERHSHALVVDPGITLQYFGFQTEAATAFGFFQRQWDYHVQGLADPGSPLGTADRQS